VSGPNPWRATTLDWAAAGASQAVRVYRGPYEYSVPGAAEDFTPQNLPATEPPGGAQVFVETALRGGFRPDTGTTHFRLGTWLFIASAVMLFGGLFSAYVLLRAGAGGWPRGTDTLSLPLGVVCTALLVAASAAAGLGASRYSPATRRKLWISAALGTAFVGVKALEYSGHMSAGHVPATNNFWAVYYLLTAIHAAHVLGGVILSAWLAVPAWPRLNEDKDSFADWTGAAARYWHFVGLVWLGLFVALYLL
jgi:heme/copper-type cytochrome/quinol oxidase subunit 3